MEDYRKEELKKDYREEMTKRKGTANNEYSFEIEDDRTVLITRSIAGIKPETKITQYFNKKGELYMISSLTSETDKDLYALYRKYDKNGNLLNSVMLGAFFEIKPGVSGIVLGNGITRLEIECRWGAFV